MSNFYKLSLLLLSQSSLSLSLSQYNHCHRIEIALIRYIVIRIAMVYGHWENKCSETVVIIRPLILHFSSLFPLISTFLLLFTLSSFRRIFPHAQRIFQIHTYFASYVLSFRRQPIIRSFDDNFIRPSSYYIHHLITTIVKSSHF